jgi:hypothetical protein
VTAAAWLAISARTGAKRQAGMRRGAGRRSEPPGPRRWGVVARSRFGGWLDEILHRLVQGVLNSLANLLLSPGKNQVQ